MARIFVLCLLFVLSKWSKAAYQPYRDTDPDYGASVYDLKLLVLEELSLLPSILTTVEKNESEIELDLKNYLADFAEANLAHLSETQISLKQFVFLLSQDYIQTDTFADDVVKHPIKSFRTIWRYVRFISRIPELTGRQELVKSFNRTNLQRIKLPKTSDLNASMLNILRLRKIFKLKVTDLVEGRLENLPTHSGLNLQQLVDIADHAAAIKMFTNAVDIYDEIMSRCNINTCVDKCNACAGINLSAIQKNLLDVLQEHDKILLGNDFDLSDTNFIPPDSSPFIFEKPLENLSSPNFVNRQHSDFDQSHVEAFLGVHLDSRDERAANLAISPVLYEKLCRGELANNASQTSPLKCFYSQGPQSRYILGPLKVETHSEVPHIVQIYDVIHDTEIKQLQIEVESEMRQSRTTGYSDDEFGETSRFRTSANAWIDDGNDERFQYLNTRISNIVGLNVTGYFSSEVVQVAAYIAGGHYTPHSDALFEEHILNNPKFPETELQRGDRIMTFMLYLSDVEKGGCTGFSVLKTLICPVKGSAVVWHNLNSDGSINYRMIHGGCPVLYGTKWIANKWIRSNDQIFSRKCPRDGKEWRVL